MRIKFLWNGRNQILSCFGFLLFHFSTFSQTAIIGRVVDEMRQPIPYAHIYLGNGHGSVTNQEGFFRLNISSDSSSVQSVSVTSIGFESLSFPVDDLPREIVLRESRSLLAEVVVVPKDHARKLIEKAIEAIPSNYPKAEERHQGFVRELTYWEGNEQQPIHVLEAVIEAVKKPYMQKHDKGNVKILEMRKYDNADPDTVSFKIYAGTHKIHESDIVAARRAFLGNPAKYDFRLVDTLAYKSNNLFKIKFSNSDVHGFVYVLDSSFAVTKAEFYYTSFSSLNIGDRYREFRDFKVWYYETEGVWRFKNCTYKTAFNKFRRLNYLESEYTSTSVSANLEDIPYIERVQYHDITLHDSTRYNPKFWDSYNIIEPDPEIEHLFESAPPIPMKESDLSLRRKFYNAISKLQFRYALVSSPLETSSSTVSYTNPSMDYSSTTSYSRALSWGLIASIEYELKNQLYVGIVIESPPLSLGTSSFDLLISKGFNLNPKGRPVRLTPGLKCGYELLTTSHSNYRSDGTFMVKDKEFDSRSTDVWLSQRNLRLQPQIQLSVEKSSRISLMGLVGYNIPMIQNDGLTFVERDEFFLWRKKQFLKNGNEDLLITIPNGHLLKRNLNLSLGLVFSF